MKRNRYIIYLLMICLSMLLFGCNKKTELSEKIVLNKGAIMEVSDKGLIYLNSNTEGQFSGTTSDKEVLTYNLESGKYMYLYEGNIYVRKDNEEVKIEDNPIYSYSLSPKGDYLFYFIKNKYLTPRIINLSDDNSSDLKNTAVISGELIGWIDDEKLAFYGVDTETKKSGIYTYDVATGKEELAYEVQGGFVTYLKSFGNSIVFFIKDLTGSTKMMYLNNKADVSLVSADVEEIKDTEVAGQDIFLLGKAKNNVYSLYKITDQEIKRLVFDFPLNISLDKGLTKNDLGEILFMGSNSNNGEKVYKYSQGTISIAYDKEGEYSFISVY